MDFWTDNEIKGKILHKLTRHGKFEASHTAIENLQKGFPSNIVGRVKDLIKKLQKEGIMYTKKTNYGEQTSINSEKKEQIMKYVEEFMKKV